MFQQVMVQAGIPQIRLDPMETRDDHRVMSNHYAQNAKHDHEGDASYQAEVRG